MTNATEKVHGVLGGPLTMRELPYNFKAACARFTIDDLSRDAEGRVNLPATFWRLGNSLYVEVWEQITAYVHQEHTQRSFTGTNAYDFVRQELRHLGYHRLLNNAVIDDRFVKHPVIKRVNATTYPVFMTRMELPLRELAQNMNDRTNKKAFCRRIGAFETSFGLIGGMLTFEAIEQNGIDFFAKNAAYNYLWFYHLADELEHLGEAVRQFETTFQEELWGPENYDQTMRDVQDSTNEIMQFSVEVARRNGATLTLQDMLDIPPFAKRLQYFREYLTPGWKLKDFDGRRMELVDKWDQIWEPALRKHVYAELPPELCTPPGAPAESIG